MFNKQLKKNIEALDIEIGRLTLYLTDEETDDNEKEVIVKRINDLTDLRHKMSEDKVNESHMKEIISGTLAVGAIILVLKYEESNIITSKAFSMASKLFRG